MKKLTSLEDTATITITGRDAVRLFLVLGRVNGEETTRLYYEIEGILPESFTTDLHSPLPLIDYYKIQRQQEALAFPQESKKDLMLKELQSKMDALQCEINKIKGETF